MRLWCERTVGIKLWGFEENPHELKNTIMVSAEAHAKGEPHGTKNFYSENQIYIASILNDDDSWGDALIELVNKMGGVDELKKLLHQVKPKNHFVIINKPMSDFQYSQSNDLSKEALNILSNLNCSVSFNFF